MFDRIARSWALSRQSWQVLKTDKQLILFPLISSIACFFVLLSFAAPVIALVDFSALKNLKKGDPIPFVNGPVYYAIVFAFYFVNFTVMSFFNAALVACAMRKFEGEEASVSTGIKIATSRLPQILGWALISATIGMVLRLISENAGIVGRIVISLIGFVWTIATWFVVPVLVVEKVGPIDAVKRSTSIIRKTWGETLVANLGLGALSVVGAALSFLPFVIGITFSFVTQTAVPALIGGGIMILMLITLALVTSTLNTIITAATYRYAATGLVPEHFDADLLQQTFRDKKSKR